MKARYGILPEDKARMLEQQKHKCPICHCHIEGKNAHIDHCHKTGKVRDILCYLCNSALGLLKDNIENCKNAAKYLKKHKKGTK